MIKVVNKYRAGDVGEGVKRINIMRGSPLGNPHDMKNKSDSERNRVCDLYEGWLREQWRLNAPAAKELQRIVGLIKDGYDIELECCCAPKRCHGDFIRYALYGIMDKMG